MFQVLLQVYSLLQLFLCSNLNKGKDSLYKMQFKGSKYAGEGLTWVNALTKSTSRSKTGKGKRERKFLIRPMADACYMAFLGN